MANIEATQEVALVLLGTGIPAIGPNLRDRKNAMEVARRYVQAIHDFIAKSGEAPYKLGFYKQTDGRYTLVIEGSSTSLRTLSNLDELMLRRFRKAFNKRMFILTSFYQGKNKSLECLALTEGLGAVLYIP
ncbi:hypothetical protein [Desulfolucanica intricata]|uniref:hypothetical protein n=1 Tax=Desulfolucanica intricata TaxID=1285191 RepID=UPI00082DE3A4|nr:hypothetical protein [Desulfolucanica intricata]